MSRASVHFQRMRKAARYATDEAVHAPTRAEYLAAYSRERQLVSIQNELDRAIG
jgi:hypothetical protein